MLASIFDMEGQNTQEQWNSYLASYDEGKPGSTTYRADLIELAPLSHLTYVLVTGITYETSDEDGLPEEDTFPIIQKIGNEVLELLQKETESVLVGSFTYDKERLEYFYVKDTAGIKEKLVAYYQANFPDNKHYINTKEDKQWEYYTEFLYPSEDILSYMADESLVRQLEKAGDDLTKNRRVDHWLYFSSESERDKCKERLLKEKFMVQSSGINEETTLPYELQVWRIDFVDLNSIYPITSTLRAIAKEFKGEYDGWETSVKKD